MHGTTWLVRKSKWRNNKGYFLKSYWWKRNGLHTDTLPSRKSS